MARKKKEAATVVEDKPEVEPRTFQSYVDGGWGMGWYWRDFIEAYEADPEGAEAYFELHGAGGQWVRREIHLHGSPDHRR